MNDYQQHLPPLTGQRTDTTSTGTSSSSSRSAVKYGLDESDTSAILTYHYGKCKIERSTQQDLSSWLDQNRQLRVSKKSIPRHTSIVEVQRKDLFLRAEQEEYKNVPNFESSLASIKLPFGVYCSRNLWNSYDKLYIISPELADAASVNSSSRTNSGFTNHITSSPTEYDPDDIKLGAGME